MTMEEATAGPPLPAAADLSRGTNQVGVRLYNERLVLSLIRRHGSLPQAQIAKLTGLSAQTISVIVKQLAKDGFLLREAPQRGKIGQPSVPFRLNPRAALSLGLKLGRRSADVVLMDFMGEILAARRITYPFPRPAEIGDFAEASVQALTRELPAGLRGRIAGLGIAAPFDLWSWRDEIGAPEAVMDEWRGHDVAADLAARTGLATHLCNDTTAACGAELVFGQGSRFESFAYFFVGSFVGGGIVIARSLMVGRTGNAGALGSILVSGGPGGGPQQLIRCASLLGLERRLQAAGVDPMALWQSPDAWEEPAEVVADWLEAAARGLAEAIVSTTAVVDFEAVVIDGAMPPAIRTRLVERIRELVRGLDRQGLSPAEIVEGSLGSPARALGGATIPLLANFAQDREVLFKAAG
ncbi:MAG: ROK family transcriptional regulator [Geminicoccaceae bacterium]